MTRSSVQFAVCDPGGPWRDQRSQRIQSAEIVGAFAGQQPELPPVAGRSDAHVGSRANRVAHLVHALPLLQVGVAGDVDNQPALLEVQIPHGRADLVAHHAVGAIAAQQVVGLDLVNVAVGAVGERDAYAISAVGQLGDLGVTA